MDGRRSRVTLNVYQLVGRCLFVGVGYALAVLATEPLLGLGAGGPTVTFLLAALGGTLLALVLSPLARHARLSRVALIGVIWFVLIMVEYVAGIVEMPFFTTYPRRHMAALVIQGMVVSLVIAALSAWLLASPDGPRSLGRRLRLWFAQRRWYTWLGRFALCGLTYVVLYLVVGGISYIAFTQPYYTDPALAERLHLKEPPNFGVIMPLEMVRGMLFALALIPLMAVAQAERRTLATWSGLILFVVGDLVPMLQGQDLPVTLRLYTGVEIFFQNFPLGLVLGYLLAPAGKPRA